MEMDSTTSSIAAGEPGTTPGSERLEPARADPRADGPAALMAEQLCRGFKHHDGRERDACVAAFFEVDRRQFAHLDDEAARDAATAYVDALWAKDDVEAPYVDGRTILDPPGLDAADWSPVRDALDRRAAVVGMPPAYAWRTTEAWRLHKTGGDYWTPMLKAQCHELRAALDDPQYPHKDGFGGSGTGPLAARYLVGVELHDMHTESRWTEAVRVMTPYFAEILDAREGDA